MKKKEMTKVWVDGKFVPATMLKVVPQEVIRYKTKDKDGYEAIVLGIGKKEHADKVKGKKVSYLQMMEFSIDSSLVGTYKQGDALDSALLDGVEQVSVVGVTKGKGFQGIMKRFHAKGGPKTHGSKFHRHVGSLGNRKPRRVQKGHPHAGRMGGDRQTIKGVKVLERMTFEGEQLFVVRGSMPGAYNDLVKVVVE